MLDIIAKGTAKKKQLVDEYTKLKQEKAKSDQELYIELSERVKQINTDVVSQVESLKKKLGK